MLKEVLGYLIAMTIISSVVSAVLTFIVEPLIKRIKVRWGDSK